MITKQPIAHIWAIFSLAGFQGFEPATEKEAQKLRDAFPSEAPYISNNTHAVAIFEQVTTVPATDEDAGDGQPITYTKPSYTKQKVFISVNDQAQMVTNMRGLEDGTLQEISIECWYNKGVLFARSVPEAPAV